MTIKNDIPMSTSSIINEGVNKYGTKVYFRRVEPGWKVSGSGRRLINAPLLSVSFTYPREGHSVIYGQEYSLDDYEKAEKRFFDVLTAFSM